MPPYVVFSDATLVAIADAAPDSRAALARISGVGPTKLDRYAEPVLAVLGGADPAEVDPVDASAERPAQPASLGALGSRGAERGVAARAR